MAHELTPKTPGNPIVAQAEPGIVSVANGQVMLDGPVGIAVTLTPDAAAETGRRLIAGAELAQAETH